MSDISQDLDLVEDLIKKDATLNGIVYHGCLALKRFGHTGGFVPESMGLTKTEFMEYVERVVEEGY